MKTMDIQVLFFGPLRSLFGDKLILQLPRGTAAGMILHLLKEKEPQASALLDHCRIAIDATMAGNDFPLSDPCEVVILPPYSGG